MQPEYTDEQLAVAQAIADNPGILCFDAVGVFETEWGTQERIQVPYITDRAVVVDVCQVLLVSRADLRKTDRRFNFNFLMRVAARNAGEFPTTDTIITTTDFVTEEQVLTELRKRLVSERYPDTFGDRFLWGDKVMLVEEEDGSGS